MRKIGVFNRTERSIRRGLERAGDVIDRKIGRAHDERPSVHTLITDMERLIDAHARELRQSNSDISGYRLKLKLKLPFETKLSTEDVESLSHRLLAASIERMFDNGYEIALPIIEKVNDVFAKRIYVDPVFEIASAGSQQPSPDGRQYPTSGQSNLVQRVQMIAAVEMPHGSFEARFEFAIGGKRLTCGRTADNDLRIEHVSVSKVHASLRVDGNDNLIVADMASTNGTFVNGRRLARGEKCIIKENSIVYFGGITVRFRREGK